MMNIFGFAVDRAFVAFIVLELVSYAERHGLLTPESHSQNIQMLTDLLSWIFSALIAVVWYISNHHKEKQKANIAAGINTDATPSTLKTPMLQQCLNTLQDIFIKTRLISPKQDVTVTTTTTTSPAVPPADTPKLQ